MPSTFDEMIEVARRAGVRIRNVRLGGGGGGLVTVKGTRQLFVDLDAHPEDQVEQTARALARLPEIDQLFLRSDVRELIDRYSAP